MFFLKYAEVFSTFPESCFWMKRILCNCFKMGLKKTI